MQGKREKQKQKSKLKIIFKKPVPVERKLAFLYLANDIMQTTRQTPTYFIDNFVHVLPKAIRDIMQFVFFKIIINCELNCISIQ